MKIELFCAPHKTNSESVLELIVSCAEHETKFRK